MAKTALEMTPKQWLAYRPAEYAEESAPEAEDKKQRAWQVVRIASKLLRSKFGATRVMVFGSLVKSGTFTPWSDIDLVAWSIPPHRYYQAVAAVTGLSPEFKVDLVDPETCRPMLLEVIERQGIEV